MSQDVDKLVNSEALAAIQAALESPRRLTEEEEAGFRQFRARASVKRSETIVLVRRGSLKYRRKGVAGADLPCHPLEWDLRARLKAYEAAISKQIPHTRVTEPATRARQQLAQERADRVLAVEAQYRHRGRNAVALIARATGEPNWYVRRVLPKSERDEES